jgi:hypothetical protein
MLTTVREKIVASNNYIHTISILRMWISNKIGLNKSIGTLKERVGIQ